MSEHASVEERPAESRKKLTPFVFTNIVIISIVGFASILLMLFGDFEGKFVRVSSTLILFAAFTLFSVLDSNVEREKIKVQISQVGNVYMLALGLILVWGTLGFSRNRDDFFDDFSDFEILPNTIILALIVRVGVMVVQKASSYASSEHEQLSLAAKLASVSLAFSTVLFTLPIGLDEFVNFGEGYWKFAVAVLLLTGLSISVAVLVYWFFGRAQKVEDESRNAYSVPSTSPSPEDFRANEPKFIERKPQVAPSVQPEGTPAPQGAQQQAPSAMPKFAPPVASNTLPWPVFPNGIPLPSTKSGRPNFRALEEMAITCAEAEESWFGKP